MILFFRHFAKKYFENQNSLSVTNFLVFWGKKIRQKRIILIQKAENILTIVYNMKGCLKNFIDILLITPNLAKHSYGRLPMDNFEGYTYDNYPILRHYILYSERSLRISVLFLSPIFSQCGDEKTLTQCKFRYSHVIRGWERLVSA